jgi:hypothetical protein
MSSGGGSSSTASKTTSEQKPVENSDKAANEAAQNAKAAMADKVESSESTILTSGKGVLDEPEYKRNLLGAGLLSDTRGQRLG